MRSKSEGTKIASDNGWMIRSLKKSALLIVESNAMYSLACFNVISEADEATAKMHQAVTIESWSR